MGTRLLDVFMGQLGELRYEPIGKRIRGMLGEQLVIDSRATILVWEPKRVVPSYAVPIEDIAGELKAPSPAVAANGRAGEVAGGDGAAHGGPVYGRSVPFAMHTTAGEPLDLHAAGFALPGAAFRPFDRALAGHVIIDFDAIDAWYEEDEVNVAHPRDPFHRVEIVHSSRHIRVERDGEVLAESTAPYLLFESLLPVRYYLPADDVLAGALRPSPTTTFCAYKGQASYWSSEGVDDIAWTYREPRREAAEVRDRVAFFNEQVDLVIDGTRHERTATPSSR